MLNLRGLLRVFFVVNVSEAASLSDVAVVSLVWAAVAVYADGRVCC